MSFLYVLLILASMYGGYRSKDFLEKYRNRRKQRQAMLRSPRDILDQLEVELADDAAAIAKKLEEHAGLSAGIRESAAAAGNVHRQIGQLLENIRQLAVDTPTSSAVAASASGETPSAADTDNEIVVSITDRRRVT